MLAAEYNNNKEVVLELLRAGANVNEKNKVSELLTYYYYYYFIIFILLFVVVGWEDSSHVGG